jgi:hypothetical protein
MSRDWGGVYNHGLESRIVGTVPVAGVDGSAGKNLSKLLAAAVISGKKPRI